MSVNMTKSEAEQFRKEWDEIRRLISGGKYGNPESAEEEIEEPSVTVRDKRAYLTEQFHSANNALGKAIKRGDQEAAERLERRAEIIEAIREDYQEVPE